MSHFEVLQPRPVNGGWSLRGYKGKGGGDARQPVEAPDSLHSTSYARVLDLLGEGEIAGLVDGLQSIYLNETPLQNADGSMNFQGVTVDFRAGTQWQDPIAGFPAAESTTGINVELKSGPPWVRGISNRNLSAVRVTLGVNGLRTVDTSTGDINGYSIDYAIDLQTDGGAWVTVVSSAFTGKTTSNYRRTHRIDLPAASTGWTVRVRRLTANAASDKVSDTTIIDSIAEVIDAKLRYPMSALVGVQIDASQFNSVPTRAYHIRGRIIRVPSNYDPVARIYFGVWDGTFKTAYTNNPAWVFYDLVTNDRYGLGKNIPAAWLNKWALYQIGAYCDELVPDGMGGQEPRFTCNLYLQERGDATRVLQDLCSVFRGMVYWAAGAAVPVADMPRDPVYTYAQSNVIDGRFVYSGSRRKDRYTVALVSYNDMTDMGRQKVIYVQDDDGVARYGVRKTEISAFGCTSAAQAHRVGQWALLTSLREREAVSFSVGLDGTLCAPGQVIRVMDSARAGKRYGGRVSVATVDAITLDSAADAGIGNQLTVSMPDGVTQTRLISGAELVNGKTRVLVSAPFTDVAVVGAVWAIETEAVKAQLFTVQTVTEGKGLTFDITGLQHEPGKFALIDHGTRLPERPVTVIPAGVQAEPAGITITASPMLATDGTTYTTVAIEWAEAKGAIAYDLEWSRSDSGFARVPRTSERRVDIPNAYSGNYLVRVRAVSPIGTPSRWAYSDSVEIHAQSLPPRNYDEFVMQELDGGGRRYHFAYTTIVAPPDLAGAEIRYIAGNPANLSWADMTALGAGYYTGPFESTQPEAGVWTFACRARNFSGDLSVGMLTQQITLTRNIGDRTPDLTPPPAPTGLTADGLFASVQVSWDAPAYEVGHGHARTEIWASKTNDRAAASKVVEGYSGPVSFATDPAVTWFVWAVNVSVDGVPSGFAGPVQAQTGEDVAGLLDVLKGQLGTAQFDPIVNDRIDTIDLLDKDGGPLGRSMIDAIASHDTAEQLVRMDMDEMADGLLQAALAADRALERITDAGVYVDPATGTVKIYGLEQTKEHVTDLQILLDVVQGTLQLKATTAYVDGKIAEAVLSPADLLLYEGLDARIVSVTQTLDSINGTLTQKASALSVQNAVARIQTAENSINAMTGQINLRVTRAEYEASQALTEQRLQSAELQIGALDGPSITATVQAFGRSQNDADESALSILRGLVSQDLARTQLNADVAFARTELNARMREGFEAEASKREQMLVALGRQQALIDQQQKATATALTAEVQQRTQLAAQVQQGQQALQASIDDARQASANADSAQTQARQTLATQVGEAFAGVQQQFTAQAGINGYQAAQYSLAVQVGAGNLAVVGGMKVTGSSSGSAGPKIAIAFATDSFLIAAPDGSKSSVPFYVQPQDQVINGQLVPAGVFMDSARIGNVEVIFGRFGTLFADKVQATAISASQLTAGNGVIGGSLKSANYVSGSSGWTLRPDGVAEFSGVIVRGTVYATAGSIAGITLAGGGLNAGAYSGYGWPSGTGTGFHLGPSGLLLGNPSTGRYVEIQAGGNVFMPGFAVQDGNAVFSGKLNVKSASSGARLEISDSLIQVFDANGVLRVRLGIW